jgi:hypothetical protein
LLARLEARIETNRETDREERKTERKANQEDHRRLLEEMNAKVDANQAEIRSTVCAIQSELEETIQHEMRTAI